MGPFFEMIGNFKSFYNEDMLMSPSNDTISVDINDVNVIKIDSKFKNGLY